MVVLIRRAWTVTPVDAGVTRLRSVWFTPPVESSARNVASMNGSPMPARYTLCVLPAAETSFAFCGIPMRRDTQWSLIVVPLTMMWKLYEVWIATSPPYEVDESSAYAPTGQNF